MFIYEKMKCDKCGEIYKGKFKLRKLGVIECYNCVDKVILPDILVEEFTEETEIIENFEAELVMKMLQEDIEKIYSGDDKFFDELIIDGEMNLEKLYFMGNPLDIVLENQKLAFTALRYLEGSNKKYEAICNEIIEIYKTFREKRYTTSELNNLWEFFNHKDILKLVELDSLNH